jgi:hypothetical protein
MPEPVRITFVFEFSEYERELVSEYRRRVQLIKDVPKLAGYSDLVSFVRESIDARFRRMEDYLLELDRDDERMQRAKEESESNDLRV